MKKKINYCTKDCRCLVYNNFDKQKKCKFYNKSIIKYEKEQCTHNFQTRCGSMKARYKSKEKEKNENLT